MTNKDIKQELDLIHFALTDLKTLCGKDGIDAVELDTFVQLIEDRFADLHPHVVSTLNVYELAETAREEGKEAALELAEKFEKERAVIHG